MNIIVEGNIGVGKSTFLKLIDSYTDDENEVKVLEEPLGIWDNLHLLESFYEDPKRWAYTFQSVAFVTRFSIAAQKINEPSTIRVMERSVFADNNCFAKLQYELGNMNELEWHAYGLWYQIMTDKFSKELSYDKIIYLRATPEACMRRMKCRNRESENTVDLSYLRALHDKYEKWLMSPQMSHKVYIIDLEDDWESVESYEKAMHSEIKSVISLIRNTK